MDKNSIRTTFRKYRYVLLGIGIILVLTGCSGDFSPIDETSTGFFNQWMVYPFSQLIKWVAVLFNGSYGMSIVAITLALRLVLLPFMLNQAKQTHIGQQKMQELKPEIDEIQEKYQHKKGAESQLEMQKELSTLYQKHNYNPLKMVTGCLPMLLQMPFLIGFYYAIRRTPEIANQSFLWFDLGEIDLLLIGVAFLTYFLQSRVSLIGAEGKQRKQASMIGLLSPITIGFISFTLPAALPLYWSVGGMFMIIQTFIIKKYVTV